MSCSFSSSSSSLPSSSEVQMMTEEPISIPLAHAFPHAIYHAPDPLPMHLLRDMGPIPFWTRIFDDECPYELVGVWNWHHDENSPHTAAFRLASAPDVATLSPPVSYAEFQSRPPPDLGHLA